MIRTETKTHGHAQELLRSALTAEEELALCRERVAELTARCKKMTASWTGVPGHSGQGPERLWARLADTHAEEQRQARTARACRLAVERVIRRVDDPALQRVLRLRYLQGLCWPEIQRQIGCSRRTVYRLHSRAAEEVEQLLWQGKNER